MNEQIKLAVGISCANCDSCAYRGSDGDGAEFSSSWDTCDKKGNERFQYLKPFPFKTEQKCWKPNFWASKFANNINGTSESVLTAISEFTKALEKARGVDA